MGRPARLRSAPRPVGWILLAAVVLAAGAALAPGRTAVVLPPAPSYDNALRTSAIDRCVRPSRPVGIAAYAFDGTRLPFTVAAGHEPGTRPRCRAGELRILALAVLTIDGQPAYVRRGGCAEPCRVRQPTVHLLARDLAGPVRLLGPAARGGDGATAGSCPRAVRAAPARAGSDLGQMYYKTPAEIRGTHRRTGVIGPGARWSNYGDPGRRFRPRADYGYLLWNLPRRASGAVLPGGGIVEAVIAQGDPVALCAVAPLTLPSFDARGARNGAVVFGYARAANAATTIYGWLLLGYRHGDRPFRATTTP